MLTNEHYCKVLPKIVYTIIKLFDSLQCKMCILQYTVQAIHLTVLLTS